MKKTLYIFAVPLVLFTLAFLLPSYTLSFDTSTLLTVVSLLFAILVGFFISTTTSNYLQLQSLVAQEDSGLIAIHNLGQAVNASESDKITDAIDQYAIASLDFELAEYVQGTEREFSEMCAAIQSVTPEGAVGVQVFSNYLERMNTLHQIRQNIGFVSRHVVRALHWCIIIFQAVLICALLYSFRKDSLVNSLIVGVLTVATYLVLILIYELDSNTFLEDQLAYVNTQQVFRVLGKLPYYPAEALRSNRVKPPKVDYRLGTRQADGSRSVKIVKVV